MKNFRNYFWAAIAITLVCLLTVVFFPMASDNQQVYKEVIMGCIAVVLFLLVLTIKVHLFDSGKNNRFAK